MKRIFLDYLDHTLFFVYQPINDLGQVNNGNSLVIQIDTLRLIRLKSIFTYWFYYCLKNVTLRQCCE